MAGNAAIVRKRGRRVGALQVLITEMTPPSQILYGYKCAGGGQESHIPCQIKGNLI